LVVGGRTKHSSQTIKADDYGYFTSTNLLVNGNNVGTLDQFQTGESNSALEYEADYQGTVKVVVPPKSTVNLGMASLGSYHTPTGDGLSPNFQIAIIRNLWALGGFAKKNF